MNAIVPINIAAIRVSSNDAGQVTNNFQGKTAAFDAMPWLDPGNNYSNQASIGDKIFHQLGLGVDGAPLNGPGNRLLPGIHLHWELPDYFKKAVQKEGQNGLTFPHAPNRWLVTRFLDTYNAGTNAYEFDSSYSWIVESDYVSLTKPADLRPVVSVPLPAMPVQGQQPFMFMGRVVDLKNWQPNSEPASNYLPSYQGAAGNDLYLTSVGFVGPYFASYYPECCSVFGFWDNFSDNTAVQDKINQNLAVQFRVSYQVTGWLSDPATDPMNGIGDQVTKQYNDYVAKCKANHTPPVSTPIDFFTKIMSSQMKWDFNTDDLSYTIDHGNVTLNIPTQTLCAGTVQEVIWNMGNSTGNSFFLSSQQTNKSVWPAEVKLAIGNSTEDALSAFLKAELNPGDNDPNVMENYELLLDALQLGLLKNLEQTPNKIVSLQEAIHNNGFNALAGGYIWSIEEAKQADDNAQEEADLPLALAEQLYLLNAAQKNYDMGRAGLLTMRKQLFMDWTNFIKIVMKDNPPSNISLNDITQFLYTSSGGELNDVINFGKQVGLISYSNDSATGAIGSINPPDSSVSPTSFAGLLWTNYNTVLTAMTTYASNNPGNALKLQCSKAPDFYMPSEPVILMEGKMMEPAQRNGKRSNLFVRLSPEIISQLDITYSATKFTLPVSAIDGIPAVTQNIPTAFQTDVQGLISEVFLITPMLAPFITTAMATLSSANNPAITSAANFTISMMYAAGGLSPLDMAPTPGGVPATASTGLYGLVNTAGYKSAANPVVNVTLPQALDIVYTNTAGNGWPVSKIGWNTQGNLPEFTTDRNDPFYPVFMIWSVSFSPLQWHDAANQIYSPTNLTDFFELDEEGVDYVYKMNGNNAAPFTSSPPVGYNDDATIRPGAANVLGFQVKTYLKNNPGDPETGILNGIADYYNGRRFLSQSISGFNLNQVLGSYVAQVPVENLVGSTLYDKTTPRIAAAAKADKNDVWYTNGFTSIEPITSGLLAQDNFGPIRAGFMQIETIEIVDVFGQRMDLFTNPAGAGNTLACITSAAMSPNPADTNNKGNIYFAPRVLAPTRLWFEWLSAKHDSTVPGVTSDFVEMNSHPATSPVTGWIMPNHLDNNIFLYNADGSAIGSFGVEQTTVNPKLVYRTRAGNLANPSGEDLAFDIGTQGNPIKNINLHINNFMWYMHGQDVTFFEHLMTTLRESENFIQPSNSQQDAALAVLIGRPLAVTRTVLGVETQGNLLPLSQNASTASSPLAQDISNHRSNYTDRMQFSSANLGNVNFPTRLGALSDLDDGLVGFIVETTGNNPYANQTLYAPAAHNSWIGSLQHSTDNTVQLNLNQAPLFLTMLVDPRASVHATTGVLAVNALAIPPSQYTDVMNGLSVNFTTRPMLQMAKGLMVPLPEENGYKWSWITPGAASNTPLKANQGSETPSYGYSPQTIQEGWLSLDPDASKKSSKKTHDGL